LTALVPDALDANAAGRLTEAQRKNLRAMSRGMRKGELSLGVALAVIGLLVWFAAGPAKYAAVKPVLGIAFLVIAGFLFVRAFLGADSLTHDLRSGQVESVEGAVTKWANTVTSRGSSSTSYYVQVDQVRAETSGAFYQAIPEAGIVRMFYLPNSHHLVNLEQLADRPLPEGALTDPRIAMRDAKQALIGSLTGGAVDKAEARAELAAIGNAMQSQFFAGGAPPPAAARDPRPLAQAIIGTWSNPMLKVVFAADGTASATMMGGVERSGRWSVDAGGRLVSDVAGSTEPVDAWIAGDRLTVTMGGRGIALQRMSS
jgi:hypothetical protein